MLDSHQAPLNGQTRTAISEGLVALLKDFYGVGPSQAKTYYYEDLVVCVLRGGFTRVEETLLEGGRSAAVIEQRMAFQEVMRDRFTAVVEKATARKVVGFMSGNQQHPDMICEVFCSLRRISSTIRQGPETLPCVRGGRRPSLAAQERSG